MDPVDHSTLLFELRVAANPETITIPADKLTPGCVLAGGTWDRHVVVSLPEPLNARRQNVALRHMHGGHRITHPSDRAGRLVSIYATKLAAGSVHLIPQVPRCIVPSRPERGDRIVRQDARPLMLGTNRLTSFDGKDWVRITDHSRNTVNVKVVKAIRREVSTPESGGWYAYLPAGHRPYLYVDGRPTPARTADELQLGDVLRLPGGARLEVVEARSTADGFSFRLETIRRSTYDLFCMMVGSNVEGAVVEHHDSGRTGYLYATEPRPTELLSTADICPGDTIISMWDRHSAAVAVADDVVRQPLSATMHLSATTADGRHFEIATGLDPRHVLLHRPARQHSYAPFDSFGGRLVAGGAR